MRQFILIDHSLKDLGGHHYPYAHAVLTAAAAAGFAPVLATHREFRERQAFDARWPVLPLFARESYSPQALDKQALQRSRLLQPARGWWSRWQHARQQRLRARQAASFAAGCAQLFAQQPPQPDDVVFVATGSELDLAGLAQFFRAQPPPAGVRWHLQLHFGFFDGRDPQHAGQPLAATAMRESLRDSLATCLPHGLQLHCTTDALTRQYQSLGVARFSTLAYPVHPLFSEPQLPRVAPWPARVACLGHARREKGYGVLPVLIRELQQDYFDSGAARLVFQTGRARERRALQSLPGAAQAIEFAPGGLDLPRYAELVRGSDVGLLLYNGERYYDRCSGVLLEMLVAGVPVVVPAGSWLSEQINAPNQSWLAELQQRAAAAQRLVSLTGSAAEPESRTAADGTLAVPLALSGRGQTLLLQLEWSAPVAPGNYLAVEFECRDAQGCALRSMQILSGPCSGDATRAAFRLPPQCSSAHLQLRPAWQSRVLLWHRLQLFEIEGEAEPLGGIGLAIADPVDAPAALRDILAHIAHYKQRAAQHAAGFARHYSARQVIAALTGAQDQHGKLA